MGIPPSSPSLILKRSIQISVTLILIALATATLVKLRRAQTPNVESYQIPAPEGAQVRLGRGTLNAISLSQDGEQLAVGSGAGIHVHDSHSLDDIWFAETSSPVLAIVYAPDGRRRLTELAVGLQDGTVLLWQVPTRASAVAESSRAVGRHDDPVTTVAWSPNGTLLASGSTSGHVTVWDLAIGEPRLEDDVWVDGHEGHTVLSFSPDGTLLAGGYSYGNVAVWEVDTGNTVWQIQQNSSVADLVWSPDGTGLIFTGFDNAAELWDIQTGEMLRAYPGFPAHSITISPDGKRMATTDIRTISMHDLDSQYVRSDVVLDVQQRVSNIVMPSEQSVISASSYDGSLTLWDVASGSASRSFYGYLDRVNGVAWSPTGDELVSGMFGTIYRWNPHAWEASRLHWTSGGGTSAPLAFTPDGQTLVANEGTAENGMVHFLDSTNGNILGNAYANRYQVESTSISPDGSILATGAPTDPYVYLFDTETYELLTRLEGPTWGAIDFAWTPDGETLATVWASRRFTEPPNNEVIIWDVATGNQLRSISTETRVISIARHPDGSLLAFGIKNGELSVWGLELGGPSVEFDGNYVDSIGSVAWSPDRSMLAAAFSDNSITVWALATEEVVHTFIGHTDSVRELAWQPGGNLLASASWDGTVIVWEVDQ